MSVDLVVAGVGGQPVDRFVELVAAAAEASGQAFTSTAPRGVSELGGPRLAQLSIGDCWSSIVTEDTGEVLVALEAGEGLRALRYCAANGVALVDRVRVPPAGVGDAYPETDAFESVIQELVAHTLATDFGVVARGAGAPLEARHAAVLGALSTLEALRPIADGWAEGLAAAGATEAETGAFQAGAAWAKEQRAPEKDGQPPG